MQRSVIVTVIIQVAVLYHASEYDIVICGGVDHR
jgi:hypothetical protein